MIAAVIMVALAANITLTPSQIEEIDKNPSNFVYQCGSDYRVLIGNYTVNASSQPPKDEHSDFCYAVYKHLLHKCQDLQFMMDYCVNVEDIQKYRVFEKLGY